MNATENSGELRRIQKVPREERENNLLDAYFKPLLIALLRAITHMHNLMDENRT